MGNQWTMNNGKLTMSIENLLPQRKTETASRIRACSLFWIITKADYAAAEKTCTCKAKK